MTGECGIVRDLLPLCADGVCSEESKKLVFSHIAECSECAGIYKQICEDETEAVLGEEASGIIERQKKKMRRKSAVAGAAVGAILAVPVLVCLIVNLASGKPLSWFFIVLASLMVAASVTVVPLVVLKDKFLWTLGAFTLSLILLFAVCCIYTHGSWFFLVSSAVLFGLAVIFLPFAANTDAAKKYFFGFRALAVMAIDTLLLFTMLLCIGLYVRDATYYRTAFPIAAAAAVLAWVIFLVARYAKISRLAKAGIFTALCGAVLFFAESFIGDVIDSHVPLPSPDFTFSQAGLDGNIKCAILAVCLISGLIMFIFGVKKGRNKR